jgi:hypothetical protein
MNIRKAIKNKKIMILIIECEENIHIKKVGNANCMKKINSKDKSK